MIRLTREVTDAACEVREYALRCAKGEVDEWRSREGWLKIIQETDPAALALGLSFSLAEAFKQGEQRGVALVVKGLKQNGL